MIYVFAGIIALWIGYLVGQQSHWSPWHGPIGAVLTVPLALILGFDPVLSFVAPLSLGLGFMACRAGG